MLLAMSITVESWAISLCFWQRSSSPMEAGKQSLLDEPDCILDDRLPSLFLETELLVDTAPSGIPGAGRRGPILVTSGVLSCSVDGVGGGSCMVLSSLLRTHIFRPCALQHVHISPRHAISLSVNVNMFD